MLSTQIDQTPFSERRNMYQLPPPNDVPRISSDGLSPGATTVSSASTPSNQPMPSYYHGQWPTPGSSAGSSYTFATSPQQAPATHHQQQQPHHTHPHHQQQHQQQQQQPSVSALPPPPSSSQQHHHQQSQPQQQSYQKLYEHPASLSYDPRTASRSPTTGHENILPPPAYDAHDTHAPQPHHDASPFSRPAAASLHAHQHAHHATSPIAPAHPPVLASNGPSAPLDPYKPHGAHGSSPGPSYYPTASGASTPTQPSFSYSASMSLAPRGLPGPTYGVHAYGSSGHSLSLRSPMMQGMGTGGHMGMMSSLQMSPYMSMGGYMSHPGTQPQERPYKCDQCPQSFNRNHDLKRHKRIHLSVKPFPCSFCDKSFSRKDALKRHRLVKGCDSRHQQRESIKKPENGV
ncbi:hypothetical protein TD95_005255 [Thielaviopsis punctulata]|uniref:C2H2-type domain-containing protein n=1 Tax=Thielaviopsis punctulata TaxID=72032 RepID=A0A0F4Z7Q7_9PEZI|nr:hypothetical protein TD95_005255 [Thielaviopsis punctulata]